jgi:hypothetical protein
MAHHRRPRGRADDSFEPGPGRGRRPVTVALTVVAAAVLVSGALVAVLAGHGSTAVASSTPAPSRSAATASAATSSTVSTKGFPTGAGVSGIFTDRCAYSHEAADDPIMYPGQDGASMHHDFFGNTATTAASTAAQLVHGATTCTTSADSSAYWAPVLYQDGTALTPGPALIYWRSPAASAASVHTIPVGLEMIAGNEAATTPQSVSVTSWGCSKARGALTNDGGRSATPHPCPAGRDIRLTVTFPNCWNGTSLNGMGQTNVVYQADGVCPSSHPVQIPQIVFHVAYPTSSASSLTLSMSPTVRGTTNSAHVDFINGWNEPTLTADVAACVATSTQCGPVTGPDATPHGPSKQQRRADALRRDHRHLRHRGSGRATASV